MCNPWVIPQLLISSATLIADGVAKRPLVTDGEVAFVNGSKFKLLRIERGNINQKGGKATVYVLQL